MGINQFADRTLAEIIEKYKVKEEDELKIRGLQITPKVIMDYDNTDESSIPLSFDWRDRGAVTKVKNQMICGSCYAFSALGSIEGQHFIQNGKLIELSEQDIIDCAGDYGGFGCEGGIPSSVFDYVTNKGISLTSDYPYEGKKGDCRTSKNKVEINLKGFGILKANNNEKNLMRAVAEIGPLDVGFDAEHESFMRYAGGIYFEKNCSNDLNHGMLLVGYGSENGIDFWILKNSYDVTWGEAGFIRVARNLGNDCGVKLYMLFPVIKKNIPKTTTRTTSSVARHSSSKSFIKTTTAVKNQRTYAPARTREPNFRKTTTTTTESYNYDYDSNNFNLTDEYLKDFIDSYKANFNDQTAD